MFRFFRRTLDVYTDGSLKRGRGAWAFVVVRRGRVVFERCGVVKGTTSNRMEFLAAIEALKFVPLNKRMILHTDSRVLLEAVVKIPGWKKLGWVKSNGAEIPSVDQMKALSSLIENRDIEWRWVKAHTGVVYNERCDQLCVQARSKGPDSIGYLGHWDGCRL